MTPIGTKGSCVNLQPLNPAWQFPRAAHLLLITTIIYIELESFTSRLGPSSNIKLCREQLIGKGTPGIGPLVSPHLLLPHQQQRWRKEEGRGTGRKWREKQT